MRMIARFGAVAAGAFGLLLAASGTSFAWEGEDGIFNSNSYFYERPEFHCSVRALFCINGGLNSGDLVNSQNIYIKGNPNHSGSATYDNGNSNTHNEWHGPQNNSEDKLQIIGRSSSQRI